MQDRGSKQWCKAEVAGYRIPDMDIMDDMAYVGCGDMGVGCAVQGSRRISGVFLVSPRGCKFSEH